MFTIVSSHIIGSIWVLIVTALTNSEKIQEMRSSKSEWPNFVKAISAEPRWHQK